MKTDNTDLYEYSLETLSNHDYYLHDITFDLHNNNQEEIITTEYEERFIKENKPIYYVVANSKKCPKE